MATSKPKKGPISITHPDLVKEWDFEKNAPLTPADVTYGSNRRVWWKCVQCGNEWISQVQNRAKHNCPICAQNERNRARINNWIEKYGSLADSFPTLAKEWDYDKNSPLTPKDFTRGSSSRVWWKCSLGHVWKTSISNRTKAGTGCPYCANKKVLVGFNDLGTTYPLISKEWNYEKNYPLTPSDIVPGSNKSFWWMCEKGHEWKVSANDRTQGHNCPFCSKEKAANQSAVTKRLKTGSLLDVNPSLAKEWHPTLNSSKTPAEVNPKSGKKFWWLCPICANSWEATVAKRAHGRGCPYCNNKIVQKGVNDLQTVHPELAQEWHPTKNGEKQPSDYFPQSNQKVWWLCSKCGHEWSTAISNRFNDRGCPNCSSERKTSFPEQAVLFYFSQRYQTVNRYADTRYEIDVFLPDINVGIEYDGRFYHNTETTRTKENKKDIHFQKLGIRIIRIKEDTHNTVEDSVVHYDFDHSYKNLPWAIVQVMNMIDETVSIPDIDIDRDHAQILGQYIRAEKENSLASMNPLLVQEWSWEKNGINPSMISCYSNKKAWWKCSKCGQEYIAQIAKRSMGRGCPYCASKKVISGVTDLQTKYPALAKEWHPTKNGVLKPSDVAPMSNKKVWWLCSNGHEWEAVISNRTLGNGCRVCSGQTVRTYSSKIRNKNEIKVLGANSLQIVRPELAKEWHPSKNGDLTPLNVPCGTHKKVWWLCSNGHEWEARVDSRTRGNNCPYCSTRKGRAVICVETGIVYTSCAEAKRATGAKKIYDCCKGTRNISGGYHWKYYDEFDC